MIHDLDTPIMALGPILPGRLPSLLLAQQLQKGLQASSSELENLQNQISAGQKFFLPGDSPAAAVRTIVTQKTLERRTQLEANITNSSAALATSDAALATVSDALNQAKSFSLAGIGQTTTAAERAGMASEVDALIQGVLNAANTQYQGRYLFAGSQTGAAPFERVAGGAVRYNGDGLSLATIADTGLLVAGNVDGLTAFGAETTPITADINPALTLTTRLADLHGGQGIGAGAITVTLDNGGTPQTQTVDLSWAQTVGDVKALLENAFSAGPLTLTVDINPAGGSGLRLTPSAGTVAVANVSGSTTAADLGLVGGPAATLTGSDLDPRLTLQTSLSALNGGTGIGPTAGFGLSITNGDTTKTVDLSSAVTVEDLLNRLTQAGLDLDARINDAGNGLAVTSRLNGVGLSIGENGGQNATRLGLRTFTAKTLLADLNDGSGVPVDVGTPLEITRRDGTTVSVDLSGAKNVQDVLDRINAVAPGKLVASLSAVGNGIALADDDGTSTGPLSVADNAVAHALGLNGTESGTDPTVPLVGSDLNAQTTTGVFGLLVRLQKALTAGDDAALGRLSGQIDDEISRFTAVRGDVGNRQKLLETVGNRLTDGDVDLKASLADDFEPDMAEVITQIASLQSSMQATLQIAAQSARLTLFEYL